MFQHPALVEALIRDRVDERRLSAERGAIGPHGRRPHRAIAAARHGVGWLLIDAGLRLAVPRRARAIH